MTKERHAFFIALAVAILAFAGPVGAQQAMQFKAGDRSSIQFT